MSLFEPNFLDAAIFPFWNMLKMRHIIILRSTIKIPFLKEDVTLLPVTNITVEELSKWFVHELIQDKDELDRHRIEKVVVKVFSAPGQSASHEWQRADE